MTEKLYQENVIKEKVNSSPNKKDKGFEIPHEDSDRLTEGLTSLGSSIDHDNAVLKEHLGKIEADVKNTKITVGQEILTVQEAEHISDLDLNSKIWQEIRSENFDHISELTYFPESLAEFLAATPHTVKHKYGIELPNIHAISDKVAEYLSKCDNYISLNGLTDISDRAAEFLGASEKNRWLKLEGLITLSDKAAEYLGNSKNKSEHLHLGCTNLSDNALKSLSHRLSLLNLDGLTSLSDKGAESLSKHDSGLTLEGLTHISDESAKYLSQRRCGVSLRGLTDISDEVAKYLGNSVWTEAQEGNKELALTGLTSISDEAAKHLSKFRGYCLNLGGVKQISDIAAMHLSQYKGWLHLGSITELSDAAAEYLSKLPGQGKRYKNSLHLKGVTEISDNGLSFLAKYGGELYVSDILKERMEKMK